MTADKIWETSLVVLGGVLTGVIGLITGWLLNKWQRESERIAGIESRKRDFLAFMAQMKAQANWQYPHGGFIIFQHNVTPNFHHASSLIRNDIPPPKQVTFEKLVIAVSTYRNGQNEHQNQEQLLKSINELISLVA